jgi:hypothetical protein
MERFPPQVLRDYALIADGERGALIGPRGDIVWMCAPRWESDAVFAALIGGEGCYAITPECRFVWGGHYEEGSLIWRSRWITAGGIIECHEALAFPAAPDTAVVLRRVTAGKTPVSVCVLLDPRAGFGQHGLRSLRRAEDGSWTGRTGELYLRWSGAVREARLRRRGRQSWLALKLRVPPGRQPTWCLSSPPGHGRPARPSRPACGGEPGISGRRQRRGPAM